MIYRRRMQIEDEFRDIISRLFGLDFEHHKSRGIRRMPRYMAGLHRRYKGNLVTTRQVLSFHFLG